MVRLDDLHPDPTNPRNNAGAVEMVAASIRTYGFLVPLVVDGDGKIVAGHTRYLAARMLRLEAVPCVQADHLTPELAREFQIAENRTSDFSFFDLGKLQAIADELSDQFVADFDMDSLLAGLVDQQPQLPVEQTPEKRDGLDLAPFEKYQYVTIICRNTYDYTNLLERLGLEDVQRRYIGGFLKRGSSTGRVIEYAEFVQRMDDGK
jgi:hypothetical protein